MKKVAYLLLRVLQQTLITSLSLDWSISSVSADKTVSVTKNMYAKI